MNTTLGPNVRIRSYSPTSYGAVDASWHVRPSESMDRMPRLWRELEELQRCEPSRDWRMEVRGTDSDWHEWRG